MSRIGAQNGIQERVQPGGHHEEAARRFSSLSGCRWSAAIAQQAVDSWAPAGSQAPIELRVNDPVRGDILFQPVHATLLPDGRVMLFAPVGVHARAAWFVPTPIGDPLPPVLRLTADHVPVNINTPIDFTDAQGRQWHFEETIFCSGHSLTSDGSIFVAGGTFFYSMRDPPNGISVSWIYGMPNTTLYSYPMSTWFRLQPDMIGTGATGSNRRWYGTVTRLSDARMLVSSGFELADTRLQVPGLPVSHHGTNINRSVEVWTPAAPPAASSRSLVSAHLQTPEEVWNPDYTHAFQVPYGPPMIPSNTVLMFGRRACRCTSWPMRRREPDGSRSAISGVPERSPRTRRTTARPR